MSIVTLNLTENHLSALVYSLDQASRVPVNNRIEKVAKSVLDNTTIMFKKRQLSVKKPTKFSKKIKKYHFSLELVEAHFLEQYLLSMHQFPFSDYDRNTINWISATINQQLA
jgi:hypothetical protein